MERQLYSELLAWKQDKNRKPLILRGARQVGKTYLLKTFGQKEYQNLIYLNFESDPALAKFFENQLDPKLILENLKIYLNQEINTENTLLIFDEIQECPNALNSLKYFQEQAPEFHIAAAGSLLGIKLANTKGFPVGKVSFYDLHPLSFSEFLNALGKIKLRDFLITINKPEPIPEPIHQELVTLLKKYFFIGGMPEAIARFISSGDITKVRQVQNEILDAYVLDFAKHAPASQVMKITTIWKSIPNQLAKENKKFVFSAIEKSARAREYETAIQWLADAGLIHLSYNISTAKIPLDAYADKQVFKIFLLDIGLLGAMSDLPQQAIVEKDRLFSEFNGSLTENFVAQEFSSKSFSLYYWSSSNKAEVDFVLSHDLDVFPLEVKAGVSTKKKSLLVFGEKYQTPLSRANLLNLKQDGNICNYPLYLVNRFPLLNKFLNTLL